jgi:hypothetical protein
MEKRESYRGFEFMWQEPPRTTAGYEINFASKDSALQVRLHQATGEKGSKVIVAQVLAEAQVKARAFVDRVLDQKR